MTTDRYMADTNNIRWAFIDGNQPGTEEDHLRFTHEFDTWIREVRSEAWEEAHRCDYILEEYHEKFCGNPYQD